MVNRPRNIGTAGETAVCRYAQQYGFPYAQRRALSGSLDRGDLDLCPGIVVEVKSGNAAEVASDAVIAAWMAETEKERINAGAAVGLLVTKRRAVGHGRAGQWSAWFTMRTLHTIGWAPIWAPQSMGVQGVTLRTTLHEALTVLRAAGYGEELP